LLLKIVDYVLDNNQIKTHAIENLTALKPWQLAEGIIEGKSLDEIMKP
jgi:hypothetical protein